MIAKIITSLLIFGWLILWIWIGISYNKEIPESIRLDNIVLTEKVLPIAEQIDSYRHINGYLPSKKDVYQWICDKYSECTNDTLGDPSGYRYLRSKNDIRPEDGSRLTKANWKTDFALAFTQNGGDWTYYYCSWDKENMYTYTWKDSIISFAIYLSMSIIPLVIWRIRRYIKNRKV